MYIVKMTSITEVTTPLLENQPRGHGNQVCKTDELTIVSCCLSYQWAHQQKSQLF